MKHIFINSLLLNYIFSLSHRMSLLWDTIQYTSISLIYMIMYMCIVNGRFTGKIYIFRQNIYPWWSSNYPVIIIWHEDWHMRWYRFHPTVKTSTVITSSNEKWIKQWKTNESKYVTDSPTWLKLVNM